MKGKLEVAHMKTDKEQYSMRKKEPKEKWIKNSTGIE